MPLEPLANEAIQVHSILDRFTFMVARISNGFVAARISNGFMAVTNLLN